MLVAHVRLWNLLSSKCATQISSVQYLSHLFDWEAYLMAEQHTALLAHVCNRAEPALPSVLGLAKFDVLQDSVTGQTVVSVGYVSRGLLSCDGCVGALCSK